LLDARLGRGAVKQSIVRGFQKYMLNPIVKPVAGILPGWALIETTGRRSGVKRRTPVGGTLEGDTFWVVAEHGKRADYVRNIEKDPRVRVRLRRRWRDGVAHLLPDDDAVARARSQSMWNSRAVRAFGTDLLTIRIDLQTPEARPEARA
jgi:deazaflavin-dependent oxidoreductase (nitroreductase family)